MNYPLFYISAIQPSLTTSNIVSEQKRKKKLKKGYEMGGRKKGLDKK